ncbi:MAG TPA: sugar ABC transporter ATP-binding protein, partial [Verrucomicrobiae bacterium]|nr:sugar ABC transporter ATP-binding protein [Verrucomicrobiae bacterium]
MQDQTPRLRMQDIRKRFGATVALDGVDLAVGAAEIHGLVGENGAGKSTLMKILSGALRPDEGTMELEGQPYHPRNPQEGRQAGVAMIYQELSLAPHLSVEENILLGIEPTRLGFVRRGEVRQRARAALEQLGHGDLDPATRVSTLSVGKQQIVEIARAMVTGCRALVLDEPTSSLSREDVERLFALMTRLKQQGYAIVYISHFLEEVKRITDRLTVLRDGRTVGGGETTAMPTREIVRLMVGRQLDELYPRSPRTPSQTIVELRDVAGATRPQGVSLTLRRGEVLGISGLIGAGRTELLRALFGLDTVKQGEIRVGAYLGPSSPARRWAQGVGLLSEDRKGEGLALALSVADNLMLSKLPRFVQPSRQCAIAEDWIEQLGVRCRDPRQAVGELSGGNQQKVALARLLHHGVDVLLLDEPTRGIDVASKA